MSRTASFEDIQDESRKVAMEWMTFTDSLAKEYVYVSGEQLHNDREIERIRGLVKRVASGARIRSYDRALHSTSVTGRMLKCLGSGAMWLALHRWSHVFLAKRDQRLGDSRKWLNMCLHFKDDVLGHFSSWLARVYPQCSVKERIKAMRILWMATFLGALYRWADCYNREPVFAFALLYPLVDDYLDTEGDAMLRADFVTRLRAKIGVAKPTAAAAASASADPPSGFKTVGTLVEIMMQHFRPSSTNRDISLRIMDSLIAWEEEKNPSDLLYAATCKGGLTLCLLHLLVKDSLSVDEAATMMRLGLALQVVDDLQDVQEDMAEATTTLATSHYYSSGDLRRQFARTINFIRHGIYPDRTLNRKLPFEDGLRVVLRESLVLLCFEAAAASPALRSEDRFLLIQHSPLSAAFLKSHPTEMALYRAMSLLN